MPYKHRYTADFYLRFLRALQTNGDVSGRVEGILAAIAGHTVGDEVYPDVARYVHKAERRNRERLLDAV